MATRSRRAIVGPLLAVLLPAVAAVLLYVNTVEGQFVHDDNLQIVQNPYVHDSVYLPRLFNSPVWAFRTNQPTNYYRPIQMALYNVLWVHFEGSPRPFHVANITLHALTSAALALLILRLGGAPVVAGGAATLFASHPINTEAVAWIACVPELSYALLTLLTLLLHRGTWDSRPVRSWASRILAWIAFAAALLSKETAVLALPLIFLLEAWLRPAGPGRARLRFLVAAGRTLPYLAVAAAYVGLRHVAVGGLAPLARPDLTFYDAVINAPALFLAYLGKLLLPVGLLAHHVFEPVSQASDPAFWGGALLVLGLAGGVLWLAPRQPLAAFAAALTCLPLLPVLYVPALGDNAFAERYAYLPAAGFCCFVIGAVHAAARARLGPRRAAAVTLLVALGVALPFGVATLERNRVWLSDENLARSVLREEPRDVHMHMTLGNWYLRQGRMEEALAAFEEGIRAAPEYGVLRANLINVRLRLGRITPAEAIRAYEEADLDEPGHYELHAVIGEAYLLARRFDEAEARFRQALALSPQDPRLYNRLAVIYVEMGRLEDAQQALERAVGIEHGYKLGWDNLSRVLRAIEARDAAATSGP